MAAGDPLREELLQRIEDLPQERLSEVHEFILSLQSQDRGSQEDPLLDVAGILNTDPLSSGDIDEELYGADPA